MMPASQPGWRRSIRWFGCARARVRRYGLLVVLVSQAAAAAYPEKPVRMILPNAAGAATDTVARIFASKLSEVMGQQFIIDNRPGAGGIIAVETVAKASPDGYTLLQCGISQAISPALKRKLPYDVGRDLARIAQYGAVPNVLVVHPSVPGRSLQEWVKYAQQNPGKLRYASPGIGFTPHLTMELFKSVAAIDVQHIPYKSSAQGIADVLSGQVHTQFNNLPSQLANIRGGKIRALAVTSAQRATQLPDVPTVAESGYPGFEVTVWYGMCAPARTPRTVLASLADGVGKALAAPDLRQRFADQGVEPRAIAGAAFDHFYQAELARWAKVVSAAGITPE
ncbi:MAG: tripartite tricarboxylate transporter substrate binding protein [Burkholderiales bacterium]|nr:tripartite tricarboxylate transporter substrate binding protein [Burkholderiales bacterium]